MADEVTALRTTGDGTGGAAGEAGAGGAGTGLQVVMAVALVGVVAGGMWALSGEFKSQAENKEPARCTHVHDSLPARYISGARLCSALNRPDLPTLLGAPDEYTQSADGSGDWITLAGGDKIAAPEANVSTQTYSVKLSADYEDFSVAETTYLLGQSAQPRTVLGHPAVLYSDRTIAFNLVGGETGTSPGGIARRLVVAKSEKDGGGSFEVAIWRQDDVTPDDAALFRIAEAVLPTVPGWTTR